MIVNLTPHPLHFYPVDCPDRIEPGQVEPLFTVPPTGQTTRIVENTLGTWFEDVFDEDTLSDCKVAVEGVEYGYITGLPLPDKERRIRYVVPLVVALAARGRDDLLVPYRDVRNMAGSVIGCRQLAQPC